jgi:GNAT superfamily N-acetyltransferase
MKEANINDRNIITELLAKSFEENTSVNYVIRQNNQKQKRLRLLMSYSFDICLLFGKVWLSNDNKACALVFYPHFKRITLKSILLDLKLIFLSIGIGEIQKVMRREILIKGKRPKRRMSYLWFLGVNPLHQRSGIGSKLLKEVIADAQQKGLPVYLETSTIHNLSWYRRFGFRIYDELTLTYILYFLKRESVN